MKRLMVILLVILLVLGVIPLRVIPHADAGESWQKEMFPGNNTYAVAVSEEGLIYTGVWAPYNLAGVWKRQADGHWLHLVEDCAILPHSLIIYN